MSDVAGRTEFVAGVSLSRSGAFLSTSRAASILMSTFMPFTADGLLQPVVSKPVPIASAERVVPKPHRHSEVELGEFVMDLVMGPQLA